MMKNNRISALILSFCLTFAIVFSAVTPIIAHAENDVILINSKEDFKEFAENCSYDLWSKNKRFLLTENISLEGMDISPIAGFSGIFDGGGHVVSDFVCEDTYAPCGLFCSLEKGGIIKNLTVTGVISPAGDKTTAGGIVGENYGSVVDCVFVGTVIGSDRVGGIAGFNATSGSISGCTVGGEIIGESSTGGISGENAGIISSCINNAKVNTVAINSSISLDDINVSLTLDISKLPTISTISVSDVGGIVGYSTGMIIGCTNGGRVGYPHIGYNVGGIAGRSSGHLSGNTNRGEIFGRKDVGGIVGQIEPYVSYKLSEDLIISLRNELKNLTLEVANAASIAGETSSSVSGNINSMLGNLDSATDTLETLIGNLTNYGDDITGEINRTGEVLKETITQISAIAKDLPELAELLASGLSGIESAMNRLDDISGLGADAIHDLMLATEDLSSAFDILSGSVTDIYNGVYELENALTINDIDKARAALDTINGGLSDIIDYSDSLSGAISKITDVLSNAVWVDNAIDQLDSLVIIFDKMAESVKTIYDSTLLIEESITVHWDTMISAGEKLTSALSSITSAMSMMDEALDLVDAGFASISTGLEDISKAVIVNDKDLLLDGENELKLGILDLTDGIVLASKAISSLADIMSNIEEYEDLSGIFEEISTALNELSESGELSGTAVIEILEAISKISDSLTIDYDLISESGELILGGTEDILNAMKLLGEAIKLLSKGISDLNRATDLMKSAIVIEDKEKLGEALENAYTALGEIINSTTEMTNILQSTVDTMREAKLWSDDLLDGISEVSSVISNITSSFVTIKDGIGELKDNVNFDLDDAKAGLDLIVDGFGSLADASGSLANTFGHLKDSLGTLENISDDMSEVIVDLAYGIGEFAKVAKKLDGIMQKASLVIEYLAGVDPIQIGLPSESITAEANKLFVSISAIEDDLSALNSDITKLSGEMITIVANINTIFDRMFDDIVKIIYGIDDLPLVDNKIDESDLSAITNGKIFGCTNEGNVSGDINIGGIGGAIGLEFALDPEDDLTPEISIMQKKQYQLKAVIQASINRGDITAKYDSVGGIVGKMDFGLIFGCEAYAEITSQAGNYVGGIAGISAGRISECFAKCFLSGGKYIGGILGSGVKEDIVGSSSLVSNCYSMVEIIANKQYAGAVAGANIGEYENNFFVSEKLQGIDRLSYHGKAESISYEELLKRRTIPDEFCNLKLEFIADGNILHSEEFIFGASFDASVYPPIPEKEGHYGYWDITDLTDLRFDTKVSVVYVPYTTAIGSGKSRDDGREIFLAEGNFEKDDMLTVKPNSNVMGLKLASKLFTKDSFIEGWIITLPTDTSDVNKIHFLPKNQNSLIYLNYGEGWILAETSELGSYLTFDVTSDEVQIAIVQHTVRILPIAIIGGVLLLGIGAWAITFLVKKKKTKAEAEKKEELSEQRKEEIK